MAPIYLRRRRNDSALAAAIDSAQAATHALAEVASRIGRDDGSEVNEDLIRQVCFEHERRQHDLKVMLAEMCAFAPDDCVDDPDEFRGSLVASYCALIEGRRPREGYVEADILTPSLMAAE